MKEMVVKYFDDLSSRKTATLFLQRTPTDKWRSSPFRGTEGQAQRRSVVFILRDMGRDVILYGGKPVSERINTFGSMWPPNFGAAGSFILFIFFARTSIKVCQYSAEIFLASLHLLATLHF